jgi:membrane complex biogenesis BtpA family protein
MFGNENDRPYEFAVDAASTATMAFVIGRLRGEISVPFGVNVLWDPMSTVALAAATGAGFVREIFTGTYASDMGPWTPDAGKAMRYRDRLGRRDLAMLYNVSAEFADSLDRRPLPDRARSAVFSSVPDAVLVSGQITGEAAALSDLEAVKAMLPGTPVMANTGVKHETVAEVLRIADGCVVGSSLKVDGDTWKQVDPERARDFMARMEIVGAPDEIPPVQAEVQAEIDKAEGKAWPMISVERYAFYERSKQAYAVIQTGERRFYGCFAFRKGVIPPDAG